MVPFAQILSISVKDSPVTTEASVNRDLVGFVACAQKDSLDPIAGSTSMSALHSRVWEVPRARTESVDSPAIAHLDDGE